MKKIEVAIVDYGLGNLFSVKNACTYVGMHATVTASRKEILSSDGVILPGVGAFGDAIAALHRLNLIDTLREVVDSQHFLMGICLGMQLLMSESYEFGRHEGLGIIKGSVIKFDNPISTSGILKVPQVGWNRVFKKKVDDSLTGCQNLDGDVWFNSPLRGLDDGEFMYFVHSFFTIPNDSSIIKSTSKYGNIEFCSSFSSKNIFATQFHPERSGLKGLQIYRNIAVLILAASGDKNISNVKIK
jgi:glutamine amidotransferase